jgi:hypothetical protein
MPDTYKRLYYDMCNAMDNQRIIQFVSFCHLSLEPQSAKNVLPSYLVVDYLLR